MTDTRSLTNWRRPPKLWSSGAGFSLIELLTVVVIIGILAIIALPSYRQYSVRSQRTDAKTALLRLATNQERFYLQNRRYGGTADLPALGFAAALSEKGAYAITVPTANADTYTATATVTVGGRSINRPIRNAKRFRLRRKACARRRRIRISAAGSQPRRRA